MSDKNVIDKIKALFNIANHDKSSDGDIQAAMTVARKMMERYHLTEEDLQRPPEVDFESVDNATFGRARSWVGGRIFQWEDILATVVGKVVGVPAYIDHAKRLANENGIVKLDPYYKEAWHGKSVVFYGVYEDATIAKHMYDELRLLISTTAYARYGTIYTKDGGVYCQGFVYGLHQQIEKEKAKCLEDRSSTAIILRERRDALIKYKIDAAIVWIENELGHKIQKGSQKSGASGSYDAFSVGKQDGQRTDMSFSRTKKLGFVQ